VGRIFGIVWLLCGTTRNCTRCQELRLILSFCADTWLDYRLGLNCGVMEIGWHWMVVVAKYDGRARKPSKLQEHRNSSLISKGKRDSQTEISFRISFGNLVIGLTEERFLCGWVPICRGSLHEILWSSPYKNQVSIFRCAPRLTVRM
jgi:hypothetical protein